MGPERTESGSPHIIATRFSIVTARIQFRASSAVTCLVMATYHIVMTNIKDCVSGSVE